MCHNSRYVACCISTGGQRVDEKLGHIPPECIQEPIDMVKDKDGRPRRGLSGGALIL